MYRLLWTQQTHQKEQVLYPTISQSFGCLQEGTNLFQDWLSQKATYWFVIWYLNIQKGLESEF